MKKLFKALFILTSFSVLTRALGFLFRIFLSRTIGPESLGIYQIAFSVFMVLETFISSGLPLIVSKLTSGYFVFDDKKKEQSMMTSALFIGLSTAILLCIIVLVFKNLISTLFTDSRCLNILLTLLPALIFSSVYSVLRGNMWGKKKYFWVSLTEFLEQLFRIIFCIIIFTLFSSIIDGTKIASLSYTFSCVFSSTIALIVYFKLGGKFGKIQHNQIGTLIKKSTPITMVRVISSLLTPLISIIIPFQLVNILGYTNEQALSIFGIAMGMTFPLLYIPSTLVGSLSVTLIPDITCAVVKNDLSEINSKINFSIKFGLFVSFLFIPLFIAIGKDIGLFLYNETLSGTFLSYSAILIIPICLSGISTSCLNALNLEVKGFINYAIGSVFLLLSIIFLTSILGIYSLVVGMFLCLGLATILNIKLLNKKQKNNFFNFSYLIKLIICAIPTIFISNWINNLLKMFLPLFFSISISCIIGEVFFLTLCLIFNLYNLSFLNLKRLKNNNSKILTKSVQIKR